MPKVRCSLADSNGKDPVEKTRSGWLLHEHGRDSSQNPDRCHGRKDLRGMNMLYEAIREKGAMVIVPSSAIETMGLGGTLATTSLAKQQ
jgi:hypothetical protein